MTVPAPPYTPRWGFLVYGFENSAGDNVLLPRVDPQYNEEQGEETHIVTVPGVGGFDVDGTNRTPPQPRTITLSSLAYASTDAYLSELRRVTQLPGKLWAVDHRATQYWSPARRVRGIVVRQGVREKRGGLVPVTLTFVMPTGVWYSRYQVAGGLYGYGRYGTGIYGSGGGAYYEYALAGAHTDLTVMNYGNAYVVALAFSLIAGAGASTITDPVVNNVTTSQTLTITGNVTAGDSWVLDTAVPSFKKGGVDDWAAMAIAAGQQGILWLAPGLNTFIITHTLVGADNVMRISFYDPFH